MLGVLWGAFLALPAAPSAGFPAAPSARFGLPSPAFCFTKQPLQRWRTGQRGLCICILQTIPQFGALAGQVNLQVVNLKYIAN